MIINVKVIANCKYNKIIKTDKGYKVYLAEKPEKGKANKKLIMLLGSYFKMPKSKLSIISGLKSQNKLININHFKKFAPQNKTNLKSINKNIINNKRYISKMHCWER